MISKQKFLGWAFVAVIGIAVIYWLSQRSQGETNEGRSPIFTEEWKEYIPNNSKFTTMLPSLPQHASDAVPLPSSPGFIKYDMYMTQEKDGTTFMISMIQYPNEFDTSRPTDILDSVQKELLAGNPHSKLRYSTRSMFQEYPAIDFIIDNHELAIRCKAFLVEKTLYVLTLIDRTPLDVEEHFGKYVEPFHLVKPAPISTLEVSGINSQIRQ
jgi:hypothetical protein